MCWRRQSQGTRRSEEKVKQVMSAMGLDIARPELLKGVNN
jgi:hypothetical protein